MERIDTYLRKEEKDALERLRRSGETYRELILRIAGIESEPISRGRPKKLNNVSGFFEEVEGCDACPEESADSASAQHDPLNPDFRPQVEEHESEGLNNLYGEPDPKRQRRDG